MAEKTIGGFRKRMAVVCHYCPVCKYARNNPDSVIGKIMHHRFHAEHCPLWKAEKAVYEDRTDGHHTNVD